MPNALGHADNYIPANPLVTPSHIVPEWYFLPFYAILRAVPTSDKVRQPAFGYQGRVSLASPCRLECNGALSGSPPPQFKQKIHFHPPVVVARAGASAQVFVFSDDHGPEHPMLRLSCPDLNRRNASRAGVAVRLY